MNRPIFMFRPNLRNSEHRKAWEILQNVPEGQKNAFLVQAVPVSAASQEDKIPQEMMGFLDSLPEDE